MGLEAREKPDLGVGGHPLGVHAAYAIERLDRRYRQTLAPVREAARIAETPRLSATLWETPGEMPAKDDLAALVATVRRAMKRGKA